MSIDFSKLSAALDCLERDNLDNNFIERIRAIDFLELQIETVSDASGTTDLIQRAQTLRQRLDDANQQLFADLLSRIRANDRSALRTCIQQLEEQSGIKPDEENIGYDELDILVNGILEVGVVPEEPEERDPDMVFYQPTPASVVLKLIKELQVAADDIFYDLGSGLGHVPILVNLLTDIKTKGVEIEAAYCRYAIECLKKLCLTNVEFINADARDVTYDDGTIFYMYTPFQGEILRQTLSKLEAQSQRRQIKLCTYGPCTALVSKQSWLQPIYQAGEAEVRLGIFSST